MYIETVSRKEYLLKEGDVVYGSLLYKKTMSEAEIFIVNDNSRIVLQVDNHLFGGKSVNQKNEVEVELKSGMGLSVTLQIANKQYYFKKTGLWKLRFTLTNDLNEELVALIPVISWTKRTYDYTLQLNDDLKNEITPLIVLHTLHCANRGINMINGSSTTAGII